MAKYYPGLGRAANSPHSNGNGDGSAEVLTSAFEGCKAAIVAMPFTAAFTTAAVLFCGYKRKELGFMKSVALTGLAAGIGVGCDTLYHGSGLSIGVSAAALAVTAAVAGAGMLCVAYNALKTPRKKTFQEREESSHSGASADFSCASRS